MRYYANTNGDHEVHTQACAVQPEPENLLYVGEFTSCEPAVAEARKTYPGADGCFYCSRACHTG